MITGAASFLEGVLAEALIGLAKGPLRLGVGLLAAFVGFGIAFLIAADFPDTGLRVTAWLFLGATSAGTGLLTDAGAEGNFCATGLRAADRPACTSSGATCFVETCLGAGAPAVRFLLTGSGVGWLATGFTTFASFSAEAKPASNWGRSVPEGMAFCLPPFAAGLIASGALVRFEALTTLAGALAGALLGKVDEIDLLIGNYLQRLHMDNKHRLAGLRLTSK